MDWEQVRQGDRERSSIFNKVPVTSYCSLYFQFTEQLGTKGHSALETLVYLAVHFYCTVFVYVRVTACNCRFPVFILTLLSILAQ